MRTLKLAIPAAVVAAGFFICATQSQAKPEYMKKENLKSCTACHVKMGMTKDAPNLNDLGKCYAENDHSLAKCKVPADMKK